MKPVLSIGFRRSGNHLLIETIRKNFDVPISRYKCAHIAPDLHTLRVLEDAYTLIYIYRSDYRAVFKSLYKFYLSGKPQKLDEINIEIFDDYDAFMNGSTLIINCQCPQIERMLKNPWESWNENRCIENLGVYTVSYEGLVVEPEREIFKISEHFGWPLKNDKPIPVTKKVGP